MRIAPAPSSLPPLNERSAFLLLPLVAPDPPSAWVRWSCTCAEPTCCEADTWGLTRVQFQLEHSERRADREHRGRRGRAGRRSEEVVRMAQEHCFPVASGW